MTIKDKIVSNLVGVDINCGMLVVELEDKKLDLESLDKCIHKYIPHGSGVNRRPHRWASKIDISQLRCKDHIRWKNQNLAIG